MVYSPLPPYEVLRTANWVRSAGTASRRFARFWDLFGNSGLSRSLSLIWTASDSRESPFYGFLGFSTGCDHGVKPASPLRRFELLWRFLTRNGESEGRGLTTSPRLCGRLSAENAGLVAGWDELSR